MLEYTVQRCCPVCAGAAASPPTDDRATEATASVQAIRIGVALRPVGLSPLGRRIPCVKQVLHPGHAFDCAGRPNELLDLPVALELTAQVDDGVVSVDAHLALDRKSVV